MDNQLTTKANNSSSQESIDLVQKSLVYSHKEEIFQIQIELDCSAFPDATLLTNNQAPLSDQERERFNLSKGPNPWSHLGVPDSIVRSKYDSIGNGPEESGMANAVLGILSNMNPNSSKSSPPPISTLVSGPSTSSMSSSLRCEPVSETCQVCKKLLPKPGYLQSHGSNQCQCSRNTSEILEKTSQGVVQGLIREGGTGANQSTASMTSTMENGMNSMKGNNSINVSSAGGNGLSLSHHHLVPYPSHSDATVPETADSFAEITEFCDNWEVLMSKLSKDKEFPDSEFMFNEQNFSKKVPLPQTNGSQKAMKATPTSLPRDGAIYSALANSNNSQYVGHNNQNNVSMGSGSGSNSGNNSVSSNGSGSNASSGNMITGNKDITSKSRNTSSGNLNQIVFTNQPHYAMSPAYMTPGNGSGKETMAASYGSIGSNSTISSGNSNTMNSTGSGKLSNANNSVGSSNNNSGNMGNLPTAQWLPMTNNPNPSLYAAYMDSSYYHHQLMAAAGYPMVMAPEYSGQQLPYAGPTMAQNGTMNAMGGLLNPMAVMHANSMTANNNNNSAGNTSNSNSSNNGSNSGSSGASGMSSPRGLSSNPSSMSNLTMANNIVNTNSNNNNNNNMNDLNTMAAMNSLNNMSAAMNTMGGYPGMVTMGMISGMAMNGVGPSPYMQSYDAYGKGFVPVQMYNNTNNGNMSNNTTGSNGINSSSNSSNINNRTSPIYDQVVDIGHVNGMYGVTGNAMDSGRDYINMFNGYNEQSTMSMSSVSAARDNYDPQYNMRTTSNTSSKTKPKQTMTI